MRLKNYLILGVGVLIVSVFIATFKQRTLVTQDLPVSNKNIFSQTPESSKQISLLLIGDVMLGRSVMDKSLMLKDPLYAFRKVYQKLLSSDIVFVNLENPFLKDCPRTLSGFKFCATPELAKGLSFSGIDVVNLANNHSRNYGQKGLDETKALLKAYKIEVTGLGNLGIVEKKGFRFGFLGFDFTSKNISEEDLFLIRNSKKKVDILIVGVHWGVEYTDKPTSLQKELARRMLKAGADIIAGHHPHWVQGIGCYSFDLSERYIARSQIFSQRCTPEEKIVYYSLGNFVFDQMWSQETRKGIVVELKFRDGRMEDQRILKTYIKNWAQPEFVENWGI